MKMDLSLFAGSYTVTVYNDGHFTATSASPNSALAKDDKSTLTITPSTGYALDEIEVISGGAEVIEESGAKKLVMGSASAVIYVKGKPAKNYKVTEECSVSINGAKTVLHKNTVVQLTKNGVPKGVTVENGGAVIADSDAVQSLIDQGILELI